jgi:hypothetical protein
MLGLFAFDSFLRVPASDLERKALRLAPALAE